ncbi:hypothetical protein BC830DRAFT_1167844 [Chytriomyces sp. MP71]|nr:hypothetical protein BC830DRAFT_1167844 [Chytriomyces sp. MP71]
MRYSCILTILLALLASVANAADITLHCKCSCPPHEAQVLTVLKCTQCNKLFCVEQGVCPNITHPSSSSSTTTSSTTTSPTATVSLPTFTSTPSGSSAASSNSSDDNKPLLLHVRAQVMPAFNGEEDDTFWVAECFQRGSYKDEIIIYVFLILVIDPSTVSFRAFPPRQRNHEPIPITAATAITPAQTTAATLPLGTVLASTPYPAFGSCMRIWPPSCCTQSPEEPSEGTGAAISMLCAQVRPQAEFALSQSLPQRFGDQRSYDVIFLVGCS